MTEDKFNPKVFISYSHDSQQHKKKVLVLHATLQGDGCICSLDVYKNSGEDWRTWMLKQLDAADYVLCIITETYKKRFEGYEEPEKGKGVAHEAKIMTDELYDNKYINERIIPVFF